MKKFVGIDYQIQVLKNVLVSIPSSSESTTKSLSSSKILAQKAVMELFITLFNTRTRDRNLFDLLHETCSLLKTTVIPLCTNAFNAPELLPHLIHLICVILTMQWRHFSSASINSGTDLRASILSPRMTIVDNKFKAEFDLFINILLDCIKTPDLPPSVVQDAICTTQELGRVINLFKVKDFEERFRSIFLATIMGEL